MVFSSILSGYMVYVVVAVLLVLFWRRLGGRSLDSLMAAATDEHHHVHGVIARHPQGGTWRQFSAWLGESAGKADS